MTIKEIAQIAGVSISTVSKIVNNKDENINAETRNRVLKIVKDYNYTPYGTVKNISEAKTFMLGLLLNASAGNSRFLDSILKTAQKNGYSLLLCDCMSDPEQELKNITALCRHKVDGVIWEPLNEKSLEYARYFESEGIEVCFVNSPADPGSRIDFTRIGYQGAKLLLDYGHTKLGCLTKTGSKRSQLVLEGFKKCLFDHGITYSDSMNLPIEQDDWHAGLFSHTPTGILSSHYAASLRLMEQLARIHYRVPDDLSLVSLRDCPEECVHYPGISTLRIPYCEFGEYVCAQLISRCEKIGNAPGEFVTDCALENMLSLGLPYAHSAKKIVVIGSINIDVTLNVEELPQPGRTVSTSRHSIIPGGKGANQAVGVARLGNDVALIGKVGSDYDSAVVYSCMEENHVDVQGISRDPRSETGKAYIHVQNDGESTITILTGANQKLLPQDIRAFSSLFENAGYCLLQTEVPVEAVREAAEIARKNGVKNILKPAAINRITPDLMQYIDIFVPNRKEAELLCPQIADVEGRAEHFLQMGAETVIITLGHRGCYVKAPDFTGYLPAADFTPVDTTGAADAFIAALAVYLSAGYGTEKAARIASYAAGFCVSRQGVIPALIDRNCLEGVVRRMEDWGF